MMYYEGKFRDFLAGWLALQLKGPETDRKQVEALYYDAVAYAENDGAAFAQVEAALGNWAARMLWGLSERWDDTSVAMARDVIEALRERVQEHAGDPAEFYLFFLNPTRYSFVPGDFLEIIWMFRVFYMAAAEMILGPKGWEAYVIVEPSYEDTSEIVLLAHPKEDFNAKVFVLQDWYKAWHLRSVSLEQLAEELLALRRAIERRAAEAVLNYRLAKATTEVYGELGRG